MISPRSISSASWSPSRCRPCPPSRRYAKRQAAGIIVARRKASEVSARSPGDDGDDLGAERTWSWCRPLAPNVHDLASIPSPMPLADTMIAHQALRCPPSRPPADVRRRASWSPGDGIYGDWRWRRGDDGHDLGAEKPTMRKSWSKNLGAGSIRRGFLVVMESALSSWGTPTACTVRLYCGRRCFLRRAR